MIIASAGAASVSAGAASVSALLGCTIPGATAVMASDGATHGDIVTALGVMVDMALVIALGAMEVMVMPDMGDMAIGCHPMDITTDTIIIRTEIGTMPTTALGADTPTERTPLPETAQEMPYVPTIIGRGRPQKMPRTAQGPVRTEVRPPEAREATAVPEAIPTLREER